MSNPENNENKPEKKGFLDGSAIIIPMFLSVFFLKIGGIGGIIIAIIIHISFFWSISFLKNRDNKLNSILIYILATIAAIIIALLCVLIIGSVIDSFNGKL